MKISTIRYPAVLMAGIALVSLVFIGCGGGSDSAGAAALTATEVPPPTTAPVATPEPTATEIPEPTPTEVPAPTPEPTPTPEATPTSEATPTPETTPTEAPTADTTETTEPATADPVTAGAAVFSVNCTLCHGPSGGGTNQGPPLAGIGQFFPDDATPLVDLVTNGGTDMPEFGSKLSADQIRSVVQFVVATFR